LTLAHTAAHIVRTVVEGLACELNRHLGFLRCADIPVCQLMMCGAAAASAVTPQLIADVTGIPVGCRSQTEGSLIGAAILARGLVESQRSLSELAAEMVPGTQKIEPGSRHPFYQDRYREYLESLRVIGEKGDGASAR
jgi:sugar (pentulose or hexulose) kinase